MDNNSDSDVGLSTTKPEDTDAVNFSTPRNPAIHPDRSCTSTRGRLLASQSVTALEASPSLSLSPFSFDPSLNLAKNKQRNKKMDKSQSFERRTRSHSRQRPRSDDDVGPVKKQRNLNASDQELPDVSTANYISMLADQVAMKINEKLDRSSREIHDKLNNIQATQEEMKTAFDSFSTRISIVEKKVEKLETDLNERLLQVENASITLTEKYANVLKSVEKVQNYNNQLAKNVDDLTQDKLNLNMFVSGLTPSQREPNGFIEFARDTLKVEASTDDFKAIFPVPTKTEPILKIIFKDMQTRIKYFAARKELTNHKDVWLREDLTKPRQHLAWLAHKAVGRNGYVRSWTSFGTVLISKGQGTIPERIENPSDLIGVPPQPSS